MVSIAVGVKPVVEVGSAAKPAVTTSVVATLVAVAVMAVPHAPDAIAVFGTVAAPLAIVDVRVEVTSGSVKVMAPSAPAGGDTVIVPDVPLLKITVPAMEPVVPTENVPGVKAF